MQHLSALAIKFALIGLLSVLILPAVALASVSQALWAAVLVTVVSYVVGDLGLLRRVGSAGAVVGEFLVVTLTLWIAPTFLRGMAIGFGGALVAAGAMAVGEILFHQYLGRVRL